MVNIIKEEISLEESLKKKISCSIDTLYKISVVLGVTMDKLFE